MLGNHRVVVLPDVAAEASNLIAFHQEPERGRFVVLLLCRIATLEEMEYVNSGWVLS